MQTSTFWRIFITWIFRSSDSVVCQSEFWRDFFSKYAPTKRPIYTVIKNWINTEKYDGVYEQKSKAEAGAVFSILFMGWITREKGVIDLIHALVHLDQHKFKLYLAGEGSEKELAQKLTVDLNLKEKVEFLGWVDGDKKLSLFLNSDILVLPSYYEGLPNVVLESMACGLPVVATSVGGIPNVIDNGINGFTVPVGDVKALADRISELMNNEELCSVFASRSRAKIESEHSIATAVVKFRKILIA